MLKQLIIIPLLSLGLFSQPVNIKEPQNAISPIPSNWSYRFGMWNPEFPAPDLYFFNSTFHPTFNTSEVNYRQPYFTRTSVGGGYTYTMNSTINNGTMALPFPIAMTFTRSTTTWDYIDSSNYYISDVYVGSDFTFADSNKWFIEFDNNTRDNYYLQLDVSSTGDDFVIVENYSTNLTVPTTITKNYGFIYTTSSAYLINISIPAYTKVQVKTEYSDGERFLDAFFLYNIGESSPWYYGFNVGNGYGYSNGLNDGFSIGYNSGFNDGLIAGEGPAYDQGYQRGLNDAMINGLKVWLVPAIIIVLIVGGGVSLWARKRREE